MSGSVRASRAAWLLARHAASIARRLRERNGWALPEHLRFRDGEDADASGADWDLPGLTAMLDAARRREFGVLIVPDLDRLARSLAKGLVVQEQLKKYGVRTVFLRVPTDDTPEGDLLKNQLLTFAQYERDKTRLRTMLNKQTKARLGEVVGAGPAPYGYRYTTRRLTNGKSRVVGSSRTRQRPPSWRGSSRCCPPLDRADRRPAQRRGRSRATRRTLAARRHLQHRHQHRLYWHVDLWQARVSGPRRRHRRRGAADRRSSRRGTRRKPRCSRRHSVRRGRGPLEADPYSVRGLLTCGHCGAHLRTLTNQSVRYYRCPWHRPYRAPLWQTGRASSPTCTPPIWKPSCGAF